MTTSLPMSLQTAAADLRTVDPRRMRPLQRRAAEKANQGVDLTAVWLDDVEHTIKCKGMDAETASAFRVACGV